MGADLYAARAGLWAARSSPAPIEHPCAGEPKARPRSPLVSEVVYQGLEAQLIAAGAQAGDDAEGDS